MICLLICKVQIMYHRLKQGDKFNRLTVIERSHSNKRGEVVWKCQCDCGKITYVPSYALVHGDTKSCGCLVLDRIREVCVKHGYTKTKLQYAHSNMMTRCYNPKYKYFHAYGGRGIKVCNEWQGEDGTTNFISWALANGYDESLTLDRIDVDGDYSPSNCRWVTMKQQQNNRTNNARYEYNGEVKTMAEWAESLGVKYERLQYLLWKKKMSMNEAVKIING